MLSVVDQKLKDLVDANQSFALFGHHNIDGDSLGSILGFGGILEKLGKRVSYFTTKQPSSIYNFLPGIEKVSTSFDYGAYDVVGFFDFTPYDRILDFTKGKESYFDASTLLIMDHHLGAVPAGADLVIKDTTAMTNAEWVYEHIKRIWPGEMDSQIATWLYLGVTTDSGNFMFDEGDQSPRVLHNAAELVDLGADKKLIVDNMFRKKSFASLQCMQEVLSRMQVYNERLLVSWVNEQEIKERGLDRFQAGYAMPLMQSIEGISVVMFFKENAQKGELSCSFRGRGQFNVADFAEIFGGGGHHNAAGCKIPVPDRDFDAAKSAMIARIEREMA